MTKKDEVERHPGSFRDPSGFIFHKNDLVLRQINQSYAEIYNHLMASGLYEALRDDHLLIPHKEIASPDPLPPPGYKIIEPEQIQFISYPYEWSFSQLKAAALTTLQIQIRAMQFGMSLKDSSAFNIQFLEGEQQLIDTLSFEYSDERKPWVAYRQFCQHFLAPLALMAYRDIRLGALQRRYVDGIPLDLASRLLPSRTWLNFSLLTHIHLHAKAQTRYAGAPTGQNSANSRGMGRFGLRGLIDSLENAVQKLKWKPEGTAWGEYYEIHEYAKESFEHKKRLVSEYCEVLNPSTVWDLGANTGVFSRIASDRGIATIAFDVDPAAVDLNYRDCVDRGEQFLLPLLNDLTNPSPGIGWENRERSSLIDRGPADTVFALALIHHLAISNNVPLPDLVAFLQKLCSGLIVEFIPKDDPQVQKLLASREDIFSEYTMDAFESYFRQSFDILRKEVIRGSKRILYMMKNNRS